MIQYDVKDDIATITWDMPGSANVLNETSMSAFAKAVNKAVVDAEVKGIIIASAKRDFIAGADLAMLQRFADGDVAPPEQFYEFALKGESLNATLRRLETSGKPVVAAINGSALGGGLEVCLGCHHRIVADKPSILLGLPESGLGLLPAGGGTQRVGRLLGWKKAADLMLSGARLDPSAALKLGLIDTIVAPDKLMSAARAWIGSNAAPKQPWDIKGFMPPGGDPYALLSDLNLLITRVHTGTQGHAPAQLAILRCLHDGLRASFEAGLRVECREFYALLKDPTAGNMIRTQFFSMQSARKLSRRPRDVAKREYKKVGVLGAGMMGAGIALVTAQAGIAVVLLDTTRELADRGKAYSDKVLSKAVAKGSLTAEAKSQTLALITPTTDFTDLSGCDLVIEAVFEDRAIKANVTKKVEAVLAPDALFGSNTSTLPITGLAEASARPQSFIGIHFFSPVERMPLVELICGKQTSETTLAHALDYVSAIAKTPIVVNDSRGFYTSRVFGTYPAEGAAMLAEGVPPEIIENAGRAVGMPVSPLALLDEISLDLVHTVRTQTAADLGKAFRRDALDDIAAKMVTDLERSGRKTGKGFYDYSESGKQLWPELREHFPTKSSSPPLDELKERLLYIQALETARCVEEGVITDAGDADIGSILGWNFPSYTGGTLSLIDTVGVGAFVNTCDRLAQAYGPRFTPPQLLRDMAAKGERFHPRAQHQQ